MGNKIIPFEASKFYHLYHHSNPNENLFRNENNYSFFLKKYVRYINPLADTYAYCLMPNHFHFLIKIKEEEILQQLMKKPEGSKQEKPFGFSKPERFGERRGFLKPERFDSGRNSSDFIIRQMGNFLNSYAKAYNKMYSRKGSLFVNTIRRKAVEKESYFTALIHYIHYNPVHHGFVKNMHDWKFSSYHAFLSDKKTLLAKETVLKWFGNRKEFIKSHQKEPAGKWELEMEFYPA